MLFVQLQWKNLGSTSRTRRSPERALLGGRLPLSQSPIWMCACTHSPRLPARLSFPSLHCVPVSDRLILQQFSNGFQTLSQEKERETLKGAVKQGLQGRAPEGTEVKAKPPATSQHLRATWGAPEMVPTCHSPTFKCFHTPTHTVF